MILFDPTERKGRGAVSDQTLREQHPEPPQEGRSCSGEIGRRDAGKVI